MTDQDTIAAIATPPGFGGVGIVRVSGSQCKQVAERLFGCLPEPRHAAYHVFHDSAGRNIDAGIALYFPGPHSFTGEDVLELQGHGGPVVMDMLLHAVLDCGVRMAGPGEFSERAFHNNKLDLAQAEAIADLIESGSTESARAALRSLQGEFSRRIHELLDKLVQLRCYVEAAIDFPEEEIDFLADAEVTNQLSAIITLLQEITASASQGRILREGLRVVLAGQPNAGKSSLLNRLAQQETAIVTDIPGTTRDVLREEINLDGLPLHIIDTAGLREGGDSIEQEGMRRTWQEIEQADQVVLIIDESKGMTDADRGILAQLPRSLPVIVLHNKIDLCNVMRDSRSENMEDHYVHFYVSIKTGEGLEEFKQYLLHESGFRTGVEGNFSARRRHLQALAEADGFLNRGKQALQENRSGELLAEDLRLTQQALGRITGDFCADDLLGEIFSSFCIGK